jgi:hypothetical protein
MKTHSYFKHFVVASLAVTTVLSATSAHAYDRYDRDSRREAEEQWREDQRVNNGIAIGSLIGFVAGAFTGQGVGRAAALITMPLIGGWLGGKIAERKNAEQCESYITRTISGKGFRNIEAAQIRSARNNEQTTWSDPRSSGSGFVTPVSDKTYYHSLDASLICREVRTVVETDKCSNAYRTFYCGNRYGEWQKEEDQTYISNYPPEQRPARRPQVPSNPGVGYPPVYQQAGIINMVILLPGCTQAYQGCIQQVMPVACNSIPNGCQLLAGHVYYAQAAPTCTQVNQSCNQTVQIANVAPDVATSTSTAVYATAIATARDQYGNVTASAAASASATTSTPLVVAPGATVNGSGQIVLQPVSPAPAPAPAPAPVPPQSTYQVPSPAVTAKIVDMKHINAIVSQHIAGVDDCRRFQVIAWYANVFVFDWRERLSTSKAAILLNTFADEQWKLETLKKIRFAILVNGVDGYCVEDSTADKIVEIFKTQAGKQQALQILSVPAPTQIAKEQGYCNCPAL